ncbi:MAG: alpha/beta hydrolase [Chitinophagaceae bacterium]
MRFIIFAFIILALASCTKQDVGNSNQNLPASNQMDISYGSDAKQKMDIYLPAGRTDSATKVLFLIHGGGWSEGDKADFSAYVSGLQNLLPGYAIININYRLTANNQNLFPTQENDIKAALEFVYSKKSTYHISEKWAYLGASAGGHLALLQAYKYSNPVKPKAVVSFFGPSELKSLYSNNLLAAVILLGATGSTPDLNPTIYQQSSPYNFITAQSPPTMLLHGGADPLVPSSQSAIVKDKLQSLGVANQYVYYPNNGHGWDGADLLDSFTKITAFLNQYVQ